MIISKNTKIFLVVFSIILISLTIIMIRYTNTHKNSDNSKVIIDDVQKQNQGTEIISGSSTDSSPIKGVDLDDTFSYNAIKFENVSENDGNISVEYPKIISGLKDESVQESVNSQIKERINKILDSNNFKKNSDSSAYVTAEVMGNFSDILSIKIFVKFNKEYNKNYGMNFRLDNGERIKFDELFTSIAPKKNILTQCAYRSFALNYYTDEGLSNDFYTSIEPDLINFMTDYKNGKISDFIVTPKYIEIYKEGKKVRINMIDYSEYMTIYNRYKSSTDLYENSDDLSKDIPVFTERAEVLIDMYKKINDVCIIDSVIYTDEDDELTYEEKKTVQAYKKELESRLDSLNDIKGLYYTNYVKVSRKKEDSKKMLIFTEDERFVHIDEENFKAEVYDKIINAERDLNDEVSLSSKINILEKKLIQKNTIDRKYVVGKTEEYKEEEELPEDNSQQNTENGATEDQNSIENSNVQNEIQNAIQNENTNNTTNVNSDNTTNTTNPEQEITTKVYF